MFIFSSAKGLLQLLSEEVRLWKTEVTGAASTVAPRLFLWFLSSESGGDYRRNRLSVLWFLPLLSSFFFYLLSSFYTGMHLENHTNGRTCLL